MKKFNVPCDVGGKRLDVDICVGEPRDGNHPLQNQQSWLARERGASIPREVMDAFQKLLEISKREGISFEELCQYAFEKFGNKKNDEDGDWQNSEARNAGIEQAAALLEKKGKGIE